MKKKSKLQSFSSLSRAKSTDIFTERVRSVVRHIPKGETLTYKQVAIKAGNPAAARAVGTIMSKNYDPKIPCHRVVRSDGKVGNYNRGGPSRKIELIMMERYQVA